jgi:DedD protein
MDKALKQRLVGASVLIALAVIVLPMLLGGRPEAGAPETQKIELPPQPPELNFETRRYPIGEQSLNGQNTARQDEPDRVITQLPAPRKPVAAPASTGAGEAPAQMEAGTEDPAAAEAGPGSVTTLELGQRSEQSVTPVPEEMPVAGVAGTVPTVPDAGQENGRYIVQVASFGAVENANKLSAVLTDSGYAVSTDRVKSDVGTLHRVRVGPYAAEAQANQVAQTLESTLSGVKPRVMDLQPEQSAQVTAPADPLVRWVVQVGSFSSAANAEQLVAALRLDGLSAYQETVTSSGSKIFRVRVGPYLQREEAIRTERRVREERSLNGVVMSAD